MLLSIYDSPSSPSPHYDLPSLHNLVNVLQKCQRAKNVSYATSLHIRICENGLDECRPVGNGLISVFLACGIPAASHQVFRKLRCRDDLSWNYLARVYLRSGDLLQALELVWYMDALRMQFRRSTLLDLLSVCIRSRCIHAGWEIHGLIAKEGYAEDVFVGTALIDMYSKFGLLSEARQVCDALASRNVVSWNALISGFAECGLSEDVFESLDRMQCEGIPPDSITFICSLRSLSCIQDLEKGQILHTQLVIAGFDSEDGTVIRNSLVSMYAKCGSFIEARHVLGEQQLPNVISWTSLIAGYVYYGMGEEALQCYENMQALCVLPDAITLLCGLMACGSSEMIENGYKLHYEISKEGFETDPYVGNALVDMYAKCDGIAEAQEVFAELSIQDVVSWNSLLALYADRGYLEEALYCLEQMERSGTACPNDISYVYIIKAYVRGSAPLCKSWELYNRITVNGCERNSFVGNALLDMYAKYGLLEEAQYLFNNISERDVISWNALITGYAMHGRCEDVLNCFAEMKREGEVLDAVTSVNMLKAFSIAGALMCGLEMHGEIVKVGIEQDVILANTLIDMYAACDAFIDAHKVLHTMQYQCVISWNALLSEYVEHEMMDEVLKCHQLMKLNGMSPDVITFICVLTACGELGSISDAIEAHAEIIKKGLDSNHFMGNSLIDMYWKCGYMEEAQMVFDAMHCRDVVTWNSLITGYASKGESETVFSLLQRMERTGVRADGVTFLNLLTLCSHAGLLDRCQHAFTLMIQEYGIMATNKHHNCMLDLLGRAGQLNEALAALELLPYQPDHVTWNTILGASQKWSCSKFGDGGFYNAMVQEANYSAAFVMFSNMCMDQHLLQSAN